MPKRRPFWLLLLAAATTALAFNIVRHYLNLHAAPITNKWENFRPLNLPLPEPADMSAACAPRNIYIDAGANLANSMDWQVLLCTNLEPCPL